MQSVPFRCTFTGLNGNYVADMNFADPTARVGDRYIVSNANPAAAGREMFATVRTIDPKAREVAFDIAPARGAHLEGKAMVLGMGHIDQLEQVC